MTTVFISYSHIYGTQVERVKQGLRAQGVRVWIDHESLAPGTPSWEQAIRQGIQAADVVLYMAAPEALLSHNVQGELDVARRHNKPILPIWLAGDGLDWVDVVPMVMSKMQYIDARGALLDAAIPRIAQSLNRLPSAAADRNVRPTSAPPAPSSPPRSPIAPLSIRQDGEGSGVGPLPGVEAPILPRLDALGFAARLVTQPNGSRVEVIIPPVCHVPAGRFLMGSAESDAEASADEKPQMWVPLAEYYIGTYPLTVAEYAYAVQAGIVKAPQDFEYRGKKVTWQSQQQYPDHPVVCITWLDAMAYAAWLARVTGQQWALPTEAEWEKAARWDQARQHARIYPWGDQWDAARANINESDPHTPTTTPVGHYRRKGPGDPTSDVSPSGASDMAGNVWEWTRSIYQSHYNINTSDNDSDKKSDCVLRGGAWYVDRLNARAAYRLRIRPVNWSITLGVRLLGRGVRA